MKAQNQAQRVAQRGSGPVASRSTATTHSTPPTGLIHSGRCHPANDVLYPGP